MLVHVPAAPKDRKVQRQTGQESEKVRKVLVKSGSPSCCVLGRRYASSQPTASGGAAAGCRGTGPSSAPADGQTQQLDSTDSMFLTDHQVKRSAVVTEVSMSPTEP